MLSNKDVSKLLNQYAALSELFNENPFKIKAISTAALSIKALNEPLLNQNENDWLAVKGIGKGIINILTQLKTTGKIQELEDLLQKTPQGVVELLQIKGLGVKKVIQLWKEHQLTSPGEVLYACNENLLSSLKGFGAKSQATIQENIQFFLLAKGKLNLKQALETAEELLIVLKNAFPKGKFESTGALRIYNEEIEYLEIIGTIPIEHLLENEMFKRNTATENEIYFNDLNIKLRYYYSDLENWGTQLFNTTPSLFKPINEKFDNEGLIFNSLDIPFIAPELRLNEDYCKNPNQVQVIQYEDLKGCLHNHSTWSDGANSIEEMALACIKNGWQYFGISDHSQSAFYANGLKPNRVLLQLQEIDALNSKIAPFTIFKGIESDILNNGELDYENDILGLFDFIVASVHTPLQMDIDKATSRLIKAIENPFTRILGHPTGRLILTRNGYPIDHQKVIDACAQNNVVIELNANPLRLDLDWRWISYALEKNVKIAINPDAHNIASLQYMKYGVMVARKAALPVNMTLNALNLNEFKNWINSK